VGGKYLVHVGYIGVSPEHRGKGNATKMMQMITQAADEVGMNMNLHISPGTERGDKSKMLTARQLHKFYAKFGFVSVTKTDWKNMKRTR
jgi:GNAT superfamily N-acetyltransferase